MYLMFYKMYFLSFGRGWVGNLAVTERPLPDTRHGRFFTWDQVKNICTNT